MHRSVPKVGLLLLGLVIVSAGLLFVLSGGDGARGSVAGTIQRSSALSPDAAEEPVAVEMLRDDGEALAGREIAVGSVSALAQEKFQDMAGTLTASPTALQLIGRVIASDGSPVEGASALFSTSEGEVPLGFDLGLRGDGEEVASVESGVDGKLLVPFGDLQPTLRGGRTLRATIRCSGFAALALPEQRMASVPPHRLGDVTLQTGAVVEGHVLRPDGEPAAAAAITFSQPLPKGGMKTVIMSRGWSIDPTDDGGRFLCNELRPGPFSLMILADGYPAEVYEGEAAVGKPLTAVTIRLRPGASISGRIEGAPPGLAIVATAVATDVDRDRPASMQPRQGLVDPTTGEFTIRGLERGAEFRVDAFVAEAFRSRERGDRIAEIDDVTAFPAAEPVVMTWSGRSAVTGRVVWYASGAGEPKPLETFIVAVASADEAEGTEFDARALSAGGKPMLAHPGGRFLFDSLRLRGGKSQSVLRVRSAGFDDLVVRGVELTPGKTNDLGDLVMTSAPSLSVRVVDAETGRNVQGAKVYFVSKSNDRWFERWWGRGDAAWSSDTVRYGETDAKGRARLPIPAGGAPYSLGVKAVGFAAPEPLQLDDASLELEVPLSRGATLAVAAVDPDGAPLEGVQIRIGSPRNSRGRATGNAPTLRARTGQDGRAVFEALPAGAYVAEAEGPRFQVSNRRSRNVPSDWPKMNVALEAKSSEEVQLSLPHILTVRGVVKAGGIPLADARLSLNVRMGPGELASTEFRSESLRTIADSDGRFEFESVPAREYELSVTSSSRAMVALVPISVAPGLPQLNIDLASATLSGRIVYDGTKDPVVGVRVSIRGPDGYPEAYVGSTVLTKDARGRIRSDEDFDRPGRSRTDGDGRFFLQGLAPGLALRLSASGERIVGKSLSIKPLAEGEIRSDVEVLITAGAMLSVAFDRVGAEPQSGGRRRSRARTTVVLERLNRNGEPIKNQQRSSSGRRSVEFRSLRPGNYRVSTFAPGVTPGGENPAADTRDIELKPGDDSTLQLRGD